MAMLTRCPHCDTVFRVTPQQLQKQHGQVRCGSCMQVFDGFRTLSSESDRTVARALAEHRATQAEVVAPPPVAAFEAVAAPESAAAAPAATPPAPESPTTPESEPAANAIADPATPAIDEPPRDRRRTLWMTGSAVLLVALILQALVVYRVEIAAQVPALRPAFEAVCAPVGCTVPLPQEPRLLSIEASDLQVPDASKPGVIQLTATVRSHAAHDLGYPALDLVLTDAQEHTLARRVFLPHEYLDPRRHTAPGIPPNAEVTLKLDLDTGALGAVGFRLDLLAAPG